VLGDNELEAIINQSLGEAGAPRVRLSPEGTCAFNYRDTVVVFERRDAAEMLMFYSPLMVLAAVGGGLDEVQVLRALMTMNLTSADLLGAGFALHPTENAIVLTYAVPLDGLDARRFGAAIDRFLVLVKAWSVKLLQAGSAGELMAAMTGAELAADEEDELPEPDEEEAPEPGLAPRPAHQPPFLGPGSFA
jgi:Tir chaperone protein (CesT) family